MENAGGRGSASDHLANERTFLAWIRTSLGLMAFGFVVVKFALFLKQLSFVLGQSAPRQPTTHSFAIGISVVGLGVLMAMLSYLRYLGVKRRLDGHAFLPSRLLPAVLAVAVLVTGILLVAYLVASTR